MSLTPSNMVPLGSLAPDFALPDAKGAVFKRDDVAMSKGLLVVFMCNHCPYVKLLKEALAVLGRKLQTLDIGTVAINPNINPGYPDDAPDQMQRDVERYGYTFPYLYDQTQSVAKAYQAACTPDFFLYDDQLHLVYRGQFDASRPRNDVPVTGHDLRAAVDAVLAGCAPAAEQIPSIGCNIKWKPGNEPDYFG